jgi:hypothetical protein
MSAFSLFRDGRRSPLKLLQEFSTAKILLVDLVQQEVEGDLHAGKQLSIELTLFAYISVIRMGGGVAKLLQYAQEIWLDLRSPFRSRSRRERVSKIGDLISARSILESLAPPCATASKSRPRETLLALRACGDPSGQNPTDPASP